MRERTRKEDFTTSLRSQRRLSRRSTVGGCSEATAFAVSCLAGKSASVPRNKQIAAMFKEAGLVEKYGSGIRRVRELMDMAQARPPQFEITANSFKVILFPSGSLRALGRAHGGVSGGVSGGVNGGVNGLVAFIREHPGLRSRVLAESLSVSMRTLERQLRVLKEQGVIRFEGAPKTGGYRVVGDA